MSQRDPVIPRAPSLHVHMLPALFEPEALIGGAAVIIDVLRASTTIVEALGHGAAGVIPCASVEEAQHIASGLAPGTVLLGGERGGVKIDGFDLDNSPRSYPRERICGKTLVFTTTNGTAALRRAALADRLLIGCLANLSAVTASLRAFRGPVHFVCAGTDGRLTAEDILCAGLLAARLQSEWGDAVKCPSIDVPTEMAIDFASSRGASSASILKTLRESAGGRNLIDLGFGADIELAAVVDRQPVVPLLDRTTGRLQASEPSSEL